MTFESRTTFETSDILSAIDDVLYNVKKLIAEETSFTAKDAKQTIPDLLRLFGALQLLEDSKRRAAIVVNSVTPNPLPAPESEAVLARFAAFAPFVIEALKLYRPMKDVLVQVAPLFAPDNVPDLVPIYKKEIEANHATANGVLKALLIVLPDPARTELKKLAADIAAGFKDALSVYD